MNLNSRISLCPFFLKWQSRHGDDYEHDSTKKKERKREGKGREGKRQEQTHHPGSAIFKNVNKCILSLYDSSNNDSIHPLSLFILLIECKCRNMPAAIPGTPATDSRKMFRIMYCLSLICPLPLRYPEATSRPHRSVRTNPRAMRSDQVLHSRWATCTDVIWS